MNTHLSIFKTGVLLLMSSTFWLCAMAQQLSPPVTPPPATAVNTNPVVQVSDADMDKIADKIYNK